VVREALLAQRLPIHGFNGFFNSFRGFNSFFHGFNVGLGQAWGADAGPVVL
jgi:hypothetical protein